MEDERKEKDSEQHLSNRREFLEVCGNWSRIVIGAAIFGGALFSDVHEANADWANRAGGWVNRGGGTAGWANRGGGSAAWANRGAAWANRGASWVNRY